MRIDAYNKVQQLYQTNKTTKNTKVEKKSFSDQLEISSIGRDTQVAKSALANTPDIREEVVATIKASMENGTYEVSAESFAQKLLNKYNESGLI